VRSSRQWEPKARATLFLSYLCRGGLAPKTSSSPLSPHIGQVLLVELALNSIRAEKGTVWWEARRARCRRPCLQGSELILGERRRRRLAKSEQGREGSKRLRRRTEWLLIYKTPHMAATEGG
jgi:hypothetical protein